MLQREGERGGMVGGGEGFKRSPAGGGRGLPSPPPRHRATFGAGRAAGPGCKDLFGRPLGGLGRNYNQGPAFITEKPRKNPAVSLEMSHPYLIGHLGSGQSGDKRGGVASFHVTNGPSKKSKIGTGLKKKCHNSGHPNS